MPYKNKGLNKGLTLIELLVAITVLAVIAVLGWRGLDSITRSRLTLTSDLEQTRTMQLSFAQLQNDCAHLADVSVLPNRASIQATNGRITLIRTVSADNQPTRLQVIAYRLKDGKLTRNASPATRNLIELDTLWKISSSDFDSTQTVVLQSGVAELKTRLWSKGNWLTDIPQLPSGIAPSGLEVTLSLQGREGSLLKLFLLGAI
jgi:general secretion pathway protein J